jgi:protein SCO1/2
MKKIVIAWVGSVLCLVMLFAWLSASVISNSNGREDFFGNAAELIQADFTLIDGNEKPLTAKDFKGRYLLVYFGFTHCPDICPTSLLLMRNALEQLGPKASKIQPLFITVDPERDTPKAVRDYTANFSKSIIGLTGTPEQIKYAADSFKVYYSKVDDNRSAMGYVVDHSGFIYLMGPNGKYLAHFPFNAPEQQLIEGLKRYVR